MLQCFEPEPATNSPPATQKKLRSPCQHQTSLKERPPAKGKKTKNKKQKELTSPYRHQTDLRKQPPGRGVVFFQTGVRRRNHKLGQTMQ